MRVEKIKQDDRDDKKAAIKKIIKAGVPDRFRGRVFGNYKTETGPQQHALKAAHMYAKNFKEALNVGASMIFCGGPGTGKTHLACAIANYLIAEDYDPLFISVIKAVRGVKETYRNDSELKEQEVIDKFISVDLLIFDEVGVQFGSKTEEMIVFEIINGRYEEIKPTIIISNYNLNGLEKYLGARVMDRLKEGGGIVVPFDWKSYRT